MDDVTRECSNFRVPLKPWHGLTFSREIPLFGAITFAIGLILASYGLVKTFGKWEATLEAITDRQSMQQSEIQALRNLPERMAAVETKIEQSSQKQNETLNEIKTLIIQTRPKNSAPSLRRP